MQWEKLGNIFDPIIHSNSGCRYGVVPFVGDIIDSKVKIFYNVRNEKNQSCLSWSIFDIEEGFELVESQQDFTLLPGNIGMFDEDGAMGCQYIEVNDQKCIFYQGWNLAKSVPFRNAIGLAVYNEGTKKYERYSKGPLLDRSIYDPCFVATPSVFKLETGKYLMYYLSCDKWVQKEGELIHKYNIKIAESIDGFRWERNGRIAIDYANSQEYAFSVPRVLFEDGVYKMWYSYRGSNKSAKYRIGYAVSKDGYNWTRKDDEVGIDVSKSGWDSEMICYPYIFNYKNERYMIYNGNNYGETGFGIAVLKR